MFQSLSANVTELFGRKREISSGGLGVGFSEKDAFWACIGETIERYCISYYNPKDFVYKKLTDLPTKERLTVFNLYSDDQYKNEKSFLNPKNEIVDWIKINSYKDKQKTIYYPASLIYIPYENGVPVAETTSTGVSTSTSIGDAIRKSILEIIERDSVVINFTMGLQPFEVDLSSITGEPLYSLVKKIHKIYHIRIIRLLSDFSIPVYLSLIWRNYKGTLRFGVGACAEFDSDIAIQKSLKECLFTYFYSKDIMDLRKENPDEIKTLYEHFLYYQDKKLFPLLFLDTKFIKYKKEKLSFKSVLKEIEKSGLEIFYKDLTTLDVKQTGIKVVRVIIPGMIDLNKTHQLIRKGAKRFRTVPVKLGFKNKTSFSTLPHPFP